MWDSTAGATKSTRLVVESENKHQWTNVLNEYTELLNEAKKSLGNI